MAGLFSKLFAGNRPAKADKTPAGPVFGEDFSFDPLADDFIADPYPTLAFLREQQPVHRSRSGAWVISRYDDVVAALSDKRLSNQPSPYAVVNPRNRDKYVCADVANNILPFIDAPRHSSMRFALGRSYFQMLREQQADHDLLNVEKIARDNLARLQGKPGFDVIHDFGTYFSGEVMCRFMGFPLEDLKQLTEWSEWFLYIFSYIPSEEIRVQVDEALLAFRHYVYELIATRRDAPQADWISALLTDNQSLEEPLTDAELVDTMMLFFADGLENVDRALGTAVKLLLEHPAQLEQVRQDPGLLEAAAQECLRFESPAQFIARVSTAEFELHGITIPANAVILVMLGSANRDDAHFPKADSFSIHHQFKATVSFGRGAHSCFGKALVNQQLQAGLQVLFEAFPKMRLVNEPYQWEKRIGHRWLINCPVEVD